MQSGELVKNLKSNFEMVQSQLHMDYIISIRDGFLVLCELLVLGVRIIYYYAEAIFKNFVKSGMKSLAGEVILITGGANGIGREVCLQLAKSGAKIVSWDLDEIANTILLKELRHRGCEAYAYVVDVSNQAEVEAAAVQVRQNVGDVTILVNNAGILPCKKFLDQSPSELEKVFGINVFSHFWTLRAFLPKMISNNSGHIVTICSVLAFVSARNLASYCATKHAVHGFVEGLRDEVRGLEGDAGSNIHFTTIYPSTCNTQLLNGLRIRDRFSFWSPFRPQDPEVVAEKIVSGMRRNERHVYIPGLAQLGAMLMGLTPSRVLWSILDFGQFFAETIPT